MFLSKTLGFNMTAIPAAIEYKLASEKQIQTQIKDAQERKDNPPSAEQIKQMESNDKLCFHNDDCRGSSDSLVDCNGGSNNKYYCDKNQCYVTMIGCSLDNYMVCENNKCVRKRLNLMIPKLF